MPREMLSQEKPCVHIYKRKLTLWANICFWMVSSHEDPFELTLLMKMRRVGHVSYFDI